MLIPLIKCLLKSCLSDFLDTITITRPAKPIKIEIYERKLISVRTLIMLIKKVRLNSMYAYPTFLTPSFLKLFDCSGFTYY